MKTLFYLSCLAIILQSCDDINQKSMDEKFLGNWKFYANIPNDKPNDHTMDGIRCPITKLENAQDTYQMKLWTGNEATLEKNDDSTLVAAEADIKIRYNQSNQHIILMVSDKPIIEFEKAN